MGDCDLQLPPGFSRTISAEVAVPGPVLILSDQSLGVAASHSHPCKLLQAFQPKLRKLSPSVQKELAWFAIERFASE